MLKRMVGRMMEWLENDDTRAGTTNFVLVLAFATMVLLAAVLVAVQPAAALLHGATLDSYLQSTGRHGQIVSTPVRPVLEGCAAAIAASLAVLFGLFAFWRGWLGAYRLPDTPPKPARYHW